MDIKDALRGVWRQADRYLVASEQDTDPAIGLVHASYAQAGYELLLVAGIPVKDRLAAAGKQQDRWGVMIRQCFGKDATPKGCSASPAGLAGYRPVMFR